MFKRYDELKDKLLTHDKKFEELEKKIDNLLNKLNSDFGFGELKEKINEVIAELETLKLKNNDILNQINENKNQIELILSNLKQNKDNFNLASNMASFGGYSKKRGNSDKIDNADLEHLKEQLEELKRHTENKIMEIEVKLDLLLNATPNIENIDNIKDENNNQSNAIKRPVNQIQSTNQTHILGKYDMSGLSQLMKKVDEVDKNNKELERSFKKFLSSFNLNDILEDIAKLKDVKADKFDIPELDSFNKLFDEIDKKNKKIESDIDEINKRLDSMYTMILNKDSNREEVDNSNTINKRTLERYVTKEDLEAHKMENEEEFNRIKKEINKLKDNISQVMSTVSKKADMIELTNLRNGVLEKLEELARACNLKFADKNECLKNFKHIEEQLKKILFLLKKRNEQGGEGDANNWLLAKKTINGYSCAACESYLGDLSNDIKKHVPWNRLPLRETSDNLYRMGSGYSKMLQMINFDNNGNVNINPDMNNEEINALISSDSNVMNMMGRTFYGKSKTQSKTPMKIRIQSASNDNENMGNNANNNNVIEEYKNYGNVGNNKIPKNKRGLPKIRSEMMSIDGFERDESYKNDPKITKIVRKSQSKSNLRPGGSKL